ncbi:hypothetical protein VQ042_25250 [Aurantimonas sp. A2-1-M11]
MALDAGFSEDEVVFMLDLDDPSPEAEIGSDDPASDVQKEMPR